MRLACTATRLPPTPAGHKQHSGDGPDTSKSSFQQPADLEVPGAGIMWDSVFLTPIPLLQDVRSWDKAVAFPLRPLSEAEAVLLLQLRVEEICETKMRSQALKQTQEVQNYYFSHEAQGNCESHQHEMHWLRINSSYCKKQKMSFPGSLGRKEVKALYQNQWDFLTPRCKYKSLCCQVPQGKHFGRWGCSTRREELRK